MADITTLRLLLSETHDKRYIAIQDASYYKVGDTIENQVFVVTPPGFDPVTVTTDFVQGGLTVLSSLELGTSEGDEEQDLPDGIWCVSYTLDVNTVETSIDRSFVRTDKLMEKFDNAFIVTVTECDPKIMQQSVVLLNRIWMLVNGSISSANNCLPDEAMKLYKKAESLLNRFVGSGCGGCTTSTIL